MSDPPKLDAMKVYTADERVGMDKIEFDEEPFITVDTKICRTCDTKPCLNVCPTKVYRLEKNELVYNTEGCIELGACAIVCRHIGKGAIQWSYPRGSYGVGFRFG
jgi:ferredoxin like protein